MKRAFASLVALCLTALPVWPDGGSDLAREASVLLLKAGEQLDAADTASDRIAALTATVRAYETGLSAMREGMRRAALRERELTEKLAAEDGEISSLLVLLETASRQTQNRALLHPGTAIQTIRAGTLAAMLVPALHQEAALLDDDLTELGALIDVQQAGFALLEESRTAVSEARLALAEAIADRTDLPPRLATDDAAMEALINSADTLSAFADSLIPDAPAVTGGPGRPWPMPVKGELLQGFNEADASGRRRPGWVIATNAEALVTAPSDATVRFSGKIPGQGTVAILEPKGGSLMILAGLGRSFVQQGQIVAKNEPIGFMGGKEPPTQENLIENSDKSSLFGVETLYMEIREEQAPVDPADLLTLVQE